MSSPRVQPLGVLHGHWHHGRGSRLIFQHHRLPGGPAPRSRQFSPTRARKTSPPARVLQVFKLDFSGQKRELPLAGGAVAASERFHRLSWSPPGSETEALPVRASLRCRPFAPAGAERPSSRALAARPDCWWASRRHCEPLEPGEDHWDPAHRGAERRIQLVPGHQSAEACRGGADRD